VGGVALGGNTLRITVLATTLPAHLEGKLLRPGKEESRVCNESTGIWDNGKRNDGGNQKVDRRLGVQIGDERIAITLMKDADR